MCQELCQPLLSAAVCGVV